MATGASFVDLKQMKSYDEAVRLLVKLGQKGVL
jgi:hypothetical protein